MRESWLEVRIYTERCVTGQWFGQSSWGGSGSPVAGRPGGGVYKSLYGPFLNCSLLLLSRCTQHNGMEPTNFKTTQTAYCIGFDSQQTKIKYSSEGPKPRQLLPNGFFGYKCQSKTRVTKFEVIVVQQ